MFLRNTRIHWIVSKALSDEAYSLGFRDHRVAHCAMTPPLMAELPFKAHAKVYRRRTPRDAALQLLIQIAAEWRSVVQKPAENSKYVSIDSAKTYAELSANAAETLAGQMSGHSGAGRDVRAEILAQSME